MTFYTNKYLANETVVAAGVLLIAVYLQSHVLPHPYSFRSAHNIPVLLSQLVIVIICCIICLSVCVMFNK